MSQSLDMLRSRIQALGMDFRFIKPIKTTGNGVEGETWLLEYEDSQFVFVPGKKGVTLGWDTSKCPLGSGVLEGLQKEFALGHEYYQGQLEELERDYQEEIAQAKEEGDQAKVDKLRAEMAEELAGQRETMEENGYTSWEDFLSKWNQHLAQCLSPLRTADIGDMLVEVDSCYLEEDFPTLEKAICSLKKGPFTLATEDEWEYICGGGMRTLFRWSDTLQGVLKEIYRRGAADDTEESPILEQPNPWGLFIAYDSYKNEIIDDLSYTKGGDGGGSLCGGDGAIYVLPCYTAFYRYPMAGRKYPLSKNYFSYRRIIRL